MIGLAFKGSDLTVNGQLLPFQGKLSNADGSVVSDGARLVQFKLYDAPIGGDAIWNGEVHKLSVNDGLINTILGSKASMEAVDFNQTVYLETTMDANGDNTITPADPPMLPRQIVLPAPFAVRAARADVATRSEGAETSVSLNGHDWTSVMTGEDPTKSFFKTDRIQDQSIPEAKLNPNILMPVGTVIQSLLPPDVHTSVVGDPSVFDPLVSKWVLADGKVDISQTRYGKLTSKQFTPDLRGVFLRGINLGREDEYKDPDGERQPGVPQKFAIQNHNHQVPIHYHENAEGGGWGMIHNADYAYGIHRGRTYDLYSDTDNKNIADETRPSNAAVFRYLKVN